MLDIDRVFGFDESLASDGVKMVLDAKGQQFFIVRRIPNPEYQRKLEQEFRRNEKVLKFGADDPETEKLSQKLMAEVIAKTVLVGLTGITVKGKKVVYSIENAIKLLIDYPTLRASIIEFGQDTTNYRLVDEVEEVKKS